MSLDVSTGALTLPYDWPTDEANSEPASSARFQTQDDATRAGINNLWIRGVTGGSANAIELTASTDVAALIPGQAYYWKAAATNTDAPNFNPNGLGAKPLVDEGFNALIAGDIVLTRWYLSTYDTASGGRFVTRFVPGASETRPGLVELATTAEASTGTDTARAVTPAGLKTVADTKANASDLSTKANKAGDAFTGPVKGKVTALSYASTITIDFSTSQHFTVTLGGAVNFANPGTYPVGQGGVIRVQQPSGGGVTPTVGNGWKRVGLAAWNTAANGVTIMGYECLVDGEILYWTSAREA